MDNKIDWYVEQVKREVLTHNVDKFHGSIEFKLNFVDGGITGINITSNKCIKLCNKER